MVWFAANSLIVAAPGVASNALPACAEDQTCLRGNMQRVSFAHAYPSLADDTKQLFVQLLDIGPQR